MQSHCWFLSAVLSILHTLAEVDLKNVLTMWKVNNIPKFPRFVCNFHWLSPNLCYNFLIFSILCLCETTPFTWSKSAPALVLRTHALHLFRTSSKDNMPDEVLQFWERERLSGLKKFKTIESLWSTLILSCV